MITVTFDESGPKTVSKILSTSPQFIAMVATTISDPTVSLSNGSDAMDVDHNGIQGTDQEAPITGIIYPPPDVRSILFESLTC
jgi:hypothetical protein